MGRKFDLSSIIQVYYNYFSLKRVLFFKIFYSSRKLYYKNKTYKNLSEEDERAYQLVELLSLRTDFT